METTKHVIHTIKGYKQVLIGPKGGKYIHVDGANISLKKLPDYLLLLPNTQESTITENTQKPNENKYKLKAKKIVDFLSHIKPKVKAVVDSRGVFTGHEHMMSLMPGSFSDDVTESINGGIAAIEYPSENKIINVEYQKISTKQMALDYIKYQTCKIYKDVF